MKNLLIPESPGFDTPLDMLEACHERVQSQLRTLQRLTKWLPKHGADADARQAARRVMYYFDTAAVNHHQDEEKDLCPLLQRRAAEYEQDRLQSLIDWVIEDHRRLYIVWGGLRSCLEAIAKEQSADLPADMVDRFTVLYQRHIEGEEAELLPMARALLSRQDQAALTASMTARRSDRQ